MAKRKQPTTASKKRFEAELQRVHDCVRREFRRTGIRTAEPWDPWPHLEKWGPDLKKVADHPECHRLTIVFFGAEEVQKTCEAQQGPRERTIEAMDDLVSAIRAARKVVIDPGVNAYLQSVSNIGHQIAFQDEPQVDSRVLKELLAELDWKALAKAAAIAFFISKCLAARRPPAFSAGTYASKGAGPFAHFCFELALEGFSLQEIAEVTDEWPKHENYSGEGNWVAACEQTEEKIRARVTRFVRRVNEAAAA